MNSKELIDFETRFLLAKYGSHAVFEALAGIKNVTVDELQERLGRVEAARLRRREKVIKSPETLIQELHLPEDRLAAIKTIASRFQARRLFPNLRDVSSFLRRHGVETKRLKSRNDAFPRLLKVLATLDSTRLKNIIDDADRSDSQDFAMLADRLMGKSND
jgi:hypothetical protein